MYPVAKAEVLRYLGHRGQDIDQRLDRIIDEAIGQCAALARPGFVHRAFDLERDGEGILLTGTTIRLTGESIQKHLEGADRCALLAATLGVAVEARIRTLERTDITASLALDAAASAMIEQVCDAAQKEVGGECEGKGLYTGLRFSPGYGDLPLALQPHILRALNAERRIGLTCTDSLILLPRKSVTAIIGLHDAPPPCGHTGCDACPRRDTCAYRKG